MANQEDAHAGTGKWTVLVNLNYQLQENIADGRFGRVCHAIPDAKTRERVGDECVAKWLAIAGGCASDPESRRYILREIDLHRSLSHRNIAKLVDHQLYDASRPPRLADRRHFHTAVLLIEKLSCSLEEYRHDHTLDAYLYNMLEDTTSALTYIHGQGIMHRDISTNNIMVAPDGELGRDVFKIIDFGLSRFEVTAEAPVTSVGGTFYAPELIYLQRDILGERLQSFEGHARAVVSNKVDMFALGAVIYYLIYGESIVRLHDTASYRALQDMDMYTRLEDSASGNLNHGPFAATLSRSNVHSALFALLQGLLQPRPEFRPSAPQTELLVAAARVAVRDKRAVLSRLGLDVADGNVRHINLRHLYGAVDAVLDTCAQEWVDQQTFDVHQLAGNIKRVLGQDNMRSVSIMDFFSLEVKIVVLYPDSDYPNFTVGMLRRRLQQQWHENIDTCVVVVAQRQLNDYGEGVSPFLADDLFRGDVHAPLPPACFETGTSLRLVLVRSEETDTTSNFAPVHGICQTGETSEARLYALLPKLKDKVAAWYEIKKRLKSLADSWRDVLVQADTARAMDAPRVRELDNLLSSEDVSSTFEQLVSPIWHSADNKLSTLYDDCQRRLEEKRLLQGLGPAACEQLLAEVTALANAANEPANFDRRVLLRAVGYLGTARDHVDTMQAATGMHTSTLPTSGNLSLHSQVSDETSTSEVTNATAACDKEHREATTASEAKQVDGGGSEQTNTDESTQAAVSASEPTMQQLQQQQEADAAEQPLQECAGEEQMVLDREEENALKRKLRRVIAERRVLLRDKQEAECRAERYEQSAKSLQKKRDGQMQEVRCAKKETKRAEEKTAELAQRVKELEATAQVLDNVKDHSTWELMNDIRKLSAKKRHVEQEAAAQKKDQEATIKRLKQEVAQLKVRLASHHNGNSADDGTIVSEVE